MTDTHPLPAREIRIGRVPDNDIVVQDLKVSRYHAELRRNPDGSFEIMDLGSHNGTYVNGERTTRKLLTEQDIISIGHATFRFSSGELHQYAGPAGTQPGLCFFDLADDGKIALITDFWPGPYDLPASRAPLVERY
jgi:predicted component of type VI protein secretion system